MKMRRVMVAAVAVLVALAVFLVGHRIGVKSSKGAAASQAAAGPRLDIMLAEAVKVGGDQFRFVRTTAQRGGMSDGMILRTGMMMNTAVSTDDPAAILALRNLLQLGDDQVKELQAIAARARQEAAAVLTEEQKAALGPAAEGPATMLEMQPALAKATSQIMTRPGVRVMQRQPSGGAGGGSGR